MTVVEKPVDLPTFRKFERYFPLAAVELVIVREDDFYLLVHRVIKPSANQWTTPGGIILRGETFEAAARRVAMREVNLSVLPTQVMLPRIHMDELRHSIGIPVLCRADDDQEVQLADDGENDKYKWFSPRAVPFLEDYYEDLLKEAGVLRSRS